MNIKEELRTDLIDKKVIIEDHIDENKYLKYFQTKHKFSTNFLSLTILLTWACNLRCVYCYEGAGDKKSYSMNKEVADSIISYVKNEIKYKSIKNLSLLLFGGEPLVNYSMGEYVLEELHSFCNEKLNLLKEDLTSLNIDFGIVRGGTEACSSYESKCYEDPELGTLMKELWEKAEAVGFNIKSRPFRKWTYCGVGKSSFINIIMGVYGNYEGNIYYNDINIKDLDLYKIRKYKIGLCEQYPYLLNKTILENLTYGISEYNIKW